MVTVTFFNILSIFLQVQQVFNERNIMTFAENPFVVTLVCTFETKVGQTARLIDCINCISTYETNICLFFPCLIQIITNIGFICVQRMSKVTT